MTPAQETALFATLARLERNGKLAIKGLQLVCTEIGIRKELTKVLDEIDREEAAANGDSDEEESPSRTTMPAPPDSEDEHEVRHHHGK